MQHDISFTMNHTSVLILVLFLAGHSTTPHTALNIGQTNKLSIRVAIAGLARSTPQNNSPAFALTLSEALSRDQRVSLIDQSLVQAALAGIKYDGSINMSKDEARKLGASIGCDFFIVGKAEVFTRSERANDSHQQAYAGVMIVDGRTGALTSFDYISNKSSTREAAQQALRKTLDARVGGYVDHMIQVRAQSLTPRSNDSARPAMASEIIEDIPDEDSPRSTGFNPPEFLNRVKPDYTTEAELADITATVEAMAVFGANGEVGRIEITRWAGFGLDESSERAIRQLKFKPASRDGNPMSVRAMIRYNFRRVSSEPNKPERQMVEPPTKPERDLRQIFKPTFRRP